MFPTCTAEYIRRGLNNAVSLDSRHDEGTRVGYPDVAGSQSKCHHFLCWPLKGRFETTILATLYIIFCFVLSIPFIIFALPFSLLPGRNSDPGSQRSQSRFFSLLPRYGSCLACLSREGFSTFFPRRLASDSACPRHEGALSNWSLSSIAALLSNVPFVARGVGQLRNARNTQSIPHDGNPSLHCSISHEVCICHMGV